MARQAFLKADWAFEDDYVGVEENLPLTNPQVKVAQHLFTRVASNPGFWFDRELTEEEDAVLHDMVNRICQLFTSP